MRIITFGVFDLFHFGHLKLFQNIKKICGDDSQLVVMVQDTKDIFKYKPNAKIFYSTAERVEMVASLRLVDEVVVYHDVDDDIQKIDFDIWIKGPDQLHAGFLRAMEYCQKKGKEIIVLPRTDGISSSYVKNIVCDLGGGHMKSRIYGDKVDIDSEKVHTFFEKRFCRENPLASVMVRASADDCIADKRNDNEKRLLKNLVDFSEPKKVLDIGCGCGRWAENLQKMLFCYDGVDFTENYVEAAKELFKHNDNIHFYQMSATELNMNILRDDYDIVILNGLCMYLNDDALKGVFVSLKSLLARDGKVYLRESVSTIGRRLTLKDFPSEELKTDYNAIYRTPEEYEQLFQEVFPEASIRNSGFLLDKETGAREETNQKYWLLQIPAFSSIAGGGN